MNSIFGYTDYRKYLNDFYTEKKSEKKGFSHRYIAKEAGFKSGGHFSLILSGKANISILLIEKFSEFLNLKKRESEYFRNMVLFNQARDHDDKRRYFEKMMSFKESSVKVINPDQYEFYDKWYYTALREVLSIKPFYGKKFRELGHLIIPAISPSETRKAIELLLKLKMISKDSNGRYVPADTLVSTGYDARSVCINNYYINTLELARNALDHFERDERNLSWVSLSVSDEGYKALIEELRAFRKRMMEIVKKDDSPERAYLFNFQIFPISERINNRKK